MFNLSDFSHKKAAVLGGGKSGKAVANLLASHGCEVLISDEHEISLEETARRISIESGGHTDKIFEADFIVKSPGILPQSPVLQQAARQKIPVFSELEVALSFLPADVRILAVTGTNGKTTTTALLGKILEKKLWKQSSRQ